MTFINPNVAIDANTLFHWDFVDGGTVFVNRGSVANAALTISGSASLQLDGVAHNSLLLPLTGSRAMTPAGSRGGSTSLTFSIWYKPTSFTSLYGEILCKEYRDVGWSSPFASFNIAMQTSNASGVFVTILTTALTNVTAHIPSGYINVGLWSLITVTWNASTGVLRSFIDGIERGSGSGAPNPIDWGPAGEGRIFLGSSPNTAQQLNGAIALARIDSVVRSDAYITNMYYEGLFNQYKRLRA
jgi:hypothetical protein